MLFGLLMPAMGAAVYWLMKNGQLDEEDWMTLKKSERLDRISEALRPILEGFREAHEHGHPGLAGVVAGLSRGVDKVEDAALEAKHAEAAEAEAAKRLAEETKAKVKADREVDEAVRADIRKEEQERADRRIADALADMIKDVRGGAIPTGPETPPPVAQRDPKKRK
jgi:hypothetical protein